MCAACSSLADTTFEASQRKQPNPRGYAMGLAFLNYRREDTGAAAQAIYAQMKVHFGSGQLFMDLNSIPAGAEWPAHLREHAERATGMLVLVGENWLRASDQWGRRRIDLPGDWVANEIRTAMDRGIQIIPVLIGESTLDIPTDALPPAIANIPFKQALYLRPRTWVPDIGHIVAVMKEQFVLTERSDLRRIVGPHPDARKANLPPVDAEVLAKFLRAHTGWEPWEDTLPREYPASRIELRKHFTFASFTDAAKFMSLASAFFAKERHHPRWNNEWRLVTVGLTTWDAKNKITKRDLEVAEGLDALYRDFKRSRRRRHVTTPRTSPSPTATARRGAREIVRSSKARLKAATPAAVPTTISVARAKVR